MKNEVVVLYLPVLDRSYLSFLFDHQLADIFVLGEDIVSEFESLRKDLRRLEPAQSVRALEAFGLSQVFILSKKRLQELQNIHRGTRFIMPDEDVCRELAQKYLPDRNVVFKFLGLRYDRKKTLEERAPRVDMEISSDVFAKEVLGFLDRQAQKSVDWWRQIGAALVRDGEVIYWAINKPTPDAYALLHMGDPRSNFKKGQYAEFSNVLHAEAAIVAQAAREGVSMEGADVYTTTLPCPPCARVLAHTGIRRLFFREGYALLDGDHILRSQNIQIIKVV